MLQFPRSPVLNLILFHQTSTMSITSSKQLQNMIFISLWQEQSEGKPLQIAKQLQNRQHPCESLQCSCTKHVVLYFSNCSCHMHFLLFLETYFMSYFLPPQESSREKKEKLNLRSLLTCLSSNFKARSGHQSTQSRKIIYFLNSPSRDLSSTPISFFRGSTQFSSSSPPR